MTKIMLFILVAGFSVMPVFAGETSTDCVMMREMNERTNPKANLEQVKSKQKKQKGAVTSQ